MRKVLIIQKSLLQYRLPFFRLLQTVLYKNNVELTLIYGKSDESIESQLDKLTSRKWAKLLPNRTYRFAQTELMWQPCLRDIQEHDMIIVEQANKLLLNYLLILLKGIWNKKVCYWGHGRDRQNYSDSSANRFKYLFLKKCDWWFAYTEGVKTFLISKGYPANKITAVQNSFETDSLTNQYDAISIGESIELKAQLGIESERIAIYCGLLYVEKRIDFILDSCLKIKAKVPDFHMIFLGDGVDARKVKSADRQYNWIHFVGPKLGEERVSYFKISCLQLMPFAVGLGILDSFAMDTPLVTTNSPFHGPEVEYLQNGKNGIMTNDNIEEYSDAIINLLLSESYKILVKNCRKSASNYSITKMVENFESGIMNALGDY